METKPVKPISASLQVVYKADPPPYYSLYRVVTEALSVLLAEFAAAKGVGVALSQDNVQIAYTVNQYPKLTRFEVLVIVAVDQYPNSTTASKVAQSLKKAIDQKLPLISNVLTVHFSFREGACA